MTDLLPATEAGLARAAALLAQGALVALPTETVYGLGADARSPAAVAAIYAAKGRPAYNPLIVHVADAGAARALAQFPPAAERLAAAFWPGPLTLVLPVAAGAAALAPAVRAGLPTLALRVPAHPVAQALLAAFGAPVAAPSANPSGRISPTTPAHVLAGLSGRIAAVLEGGACPVGVESTIVAVQADGTARLLRPGGIAREALEAVMGAALEGPPEALSEALSEAPAKAPAEPRPSAPGQLASHYAPRAAVVLNAPARPAGALWLGFGPGCAGADLNLSPRGDLAEAAACLFAALHTLDARAAPGQPIAVAPIPRAGIGAAINDRLARAAAPRPQPHP